MSKIENLIIIFMSITVVFCCLYIIWSSLYGAPEKTHSILEYEKYIDVVKNNHTMHACISGTRRVCKKYMTIDSEAALVSYINIKYDTDVLNKIEQYNKELQEYNKRNSREQGE